MSRMKTGRISDTIFSSSLLLKWYPWEPPANGSRSTSIQSRKFYHAQGNDINLTPQYMPDHKRTRETVSSADTWIGFKAVGEIRRGGEEKAISLSEMYFLGLINLMSPC